MSAGQAAANENDDATTIGQLLHYARRAGYLEGALRAIAEGTTGVRPRLAARRALEAVGKDWLVNGTPPTHATPAQGSVPKVRRKKETA